jgi:beta-phosphoglucomutase
MNLDLSSYRGFIFDLDGVIVDTRPYHLRAWQRLAEELGVEINEQSNEELRRLSRMEGIEKIMEWGHLYASDAEKMFWADRKNKWYIELIAQMSPSEILPGVMDFLLVLKQYDYPTALVSSSANARKVLLSIGLDPYFDVVIDGTIAKKSKPAPDCFLMAAHELGLKPAECLVFEDAPVGTQAARAGGFKSVAVGIHRDLCNANYTIEGFDNFSYRLFHETNLIHTTSE